MHINKVKNIILQTIAVLLILVSPVTALAVHAAGDIKAQPKAPFQNTMSGPIASKASRTEKTLATTSWSVGLSSNTTSLWPMQYATLTARTTADVGPTPYYLSIYDKTAASYVAICSTGTTCTAAVTQPTAMTHTYVAYVSNYPSTNPPAGLQATSSTITITWRSISIAIKANPTNLGLGGTATITSTTSADVGPTPFYAQIYDATTATRLASCATGTICTATTSQTTATTHHFVAYVSLYTSLYPPSGVQAISPLSFVTWSNLGYRVSLSATRSAYGQDTLTASTNINVGPTPYFIEVFNENTGARLAVCGSGTSCSAVTSLNIGANNYVAFISSYDTTFPPAVIAASSNLVTDTFIPILSSQK